MEVFKRVYDIFMAIKSHLYKVLFTTLIITENETKAATVQLRSDGVHAIPGSPVTH